MTARLENAVVTSTADQAPLASFSNSPSTCVLVISISFADNKPLDSGNVVTSNVPFGGRLVRIHSLGIEACCLSFLSAMRASQFCAIVKSLDVSGEVTSSFRDGGLTLMLNTIYNQVLTKKTWEVVEPIRRKKAFECTGTVAHR
jgi:hypothetical protein